MVTQTKEKHVFNNAHIGIICTLTAILLLSFRGILVKLAYQHNISVMDLFYYRFLFSLPLLWGFALYTKRKQLKQLKLNNFNIIISCICAGFFGYYLATLMDFYSLKFIDVNISRVITYTFPAYVLIWNAIIEKRLPQSKYIVAFLIIQIGLYFTLGGLDISLLIANKTGAIFALISAISYSFYIIINQQIGKKIGSILFTTLAVTFSFLFINLHFFVFYNADSATISITGFIIILTIAVFCTFIPLLLISEGIKRIGAARLSLLTTIGPITTALFAFIILGETLTYQQMVGAILVITVLIVIERRVKNSK